VITINDTTTISLDTFTLSDNHSIAGYLSSTSEGGSTSAG
jgi:hypothetical protein